MSQPTCHGQQQAGTGAPMLACVPPGYLLTPSHHSALDIAHAHPCLAPLRDLRPVIEGVSFCY